MGDKVDSVVATILAAQELKAVKERHRRIEEYQRAQWGWGNFLILDDYDDASGRPLADTIEERDGTIPTPGEGSSETQ